MTKENRPILELLTRMRLGRQFNTASLSRSLYRNSNSVETLESFKLEVEHRILPIYGYNKPPEQIVRMLHLVSRLGKHKSPIVEMVARNSYGAILDLFVVHNTVDIYNLVSKVRDIIFLSIVFTAEYDYLKEVKSLGYYQKCLIVFILLKSFTKSEIIDTISTFLRDKKFPDIDIKKEISNFEKDIPSFKEDTYNIVTFAPYTSIIDRVMKNCNTVRLDDYEIPDDVEILVDNFIASVESKLHHSAPVTRTMIYNYIKDRIKKEI